MVFKFFVQLADLHILQAVIVADYWECGQPVSLFDMRIDIEV